ncbi:hypothetical protein RhiirA4_507466 [Rhizophagus irregularis]|uniref:Uncharacterized protein n=1 Tax=Rhizophagus irregularis TaxID=588596 RepID=A0A2I1HCC4_9GLOM|nr:hypothetical protein RhiirA4_507466 [Rhizophagus irregularis]
MSAVALESAIGVKMIIDKKEWQLPKPVSNRPGYDMEYYRVYLGNYFGNMNIKKFLDNEKLYDSLSIMRKEESPMQWGLRVKTTLQSLLSQKEYSIYHTFCLFAGYGEVEFDKSYHEYYRPKIHKNNLAICFRCWKPFQVNEIKPTKSYHHGWHRFIELIEAKDMMQGHWDQECSDPLSDLGRARVKQQAFDKFKENDLMGVYCNKLRPPLNKYQNSVRDESHSSTPNILFISSRYAKQPKGTALRLRDGTVIMIV